MLNPIAITGKGEKSMKPKRIYGPELLDEALRHQQELRRQLIARFGYGIGEDVDEYVDAIRLASYIAGTWAHAPINETVEFPELEVIA